jgi:hypothetical protein
VKGLYAAALVHVPTMHSLVPSTLPGMYGHKGTPVQTKRPSNTHPHHHQINPTLKETNHLLDYTVQYYTFHFALTIHTDTSDEHQVLKDGYLFI